MFFAFISSKAPTTCTSGCTDTTGRHHVADVKREESRLIEDALREIALPDGSSAVRDDDRADVVVDHHTHGVFDGVAGDTVTTSRDMTSPTVSGALVIDASVSESSSGC